MLMCQGGLSRVGNKFILSITFLGFGGGLEGYFFGIIKNKFIL